MRFTYDGDRAITCVQSDHDVGFEQTRQEYSAVYSRTFRTKRELINWISDFNGALLSCVRSATPINLTLNLDNPIISKSLELSRSLKECNLGFNETDFEFFEGARYIDSHPDF